MQTNILQDFFLSLEMKGLRPLTIQYYKKYITRFIDLTKISFEGFGDSNEFEYAYSLLWKRDISNETRKKYLKCARIFSDFLLKKGIIEVNCAREMKCPRVQLQLPISMKRDEILEMVHAIDREWEGELAERNKMIVMTFLYSGVRRSELIKIRREDCTSSEIRVRDGKGGKDRIIYIPEWFGEQIIEFMKHTGGSYGFLFYGRDKQLRERTISGIFQRIRKRTGLQVHPHKLRHTFATETLKAGVNIYTLQRQLGHTNVVTTSRYLSIHDEERRNEVNRKIKEIVF